MPWRPPICPPRPTDGRGRCPGASGPPQSGGPAHQPGQLAPSVVRPCGLAGAGRGPAPPAPVAPPGAPSRCPAGPLALAGLRAVWSRVSAPAPLLRAGPAHRAGPPSAGAGAAAPPPGAGAVVGSRPRPLPWPIGAGAPPSRGRRGSPPPRPLRRLGAAAGRALQLRRRALGWAPPAPAPPGRPGSPLLPSGRPCVWWAALRLLRAPPCGRSLRAAGPAPPRRGAAGPLRGPLGRSAAPRLALPRRCAVGHPAHGAVAWGQLARGAGIQGTLVGR